MKCIPQSYACYKQSAVVKRTLQSINVCCGQISLDASYQRIQKLIKVVIPFVAFSQVPPDLTYVQIGSRTLALDLIIELLSLLVVPSHLLLQCLVGPSTFLLLFDAF